MQARGIFKKKGVTPLVGDHIRYSHTENGEGVVDEILPRRSELIRPPVATWIWLFWYFRCASPI
ncbi:putative ribosome biogenesis GTPase RsgA [Paenibacillus sp. P1XP2]|nr:putative ribosome biogenesis GTPase RsgA [Paenibacillus sp. P1XP2]